jgi:hypothetical protein
MKKTNSISILFLFYLTVILCFAIISCAKKGVKLSTTSKELSEKMINNPVFEKNAKGENFCWNARVGMDQFINNYRLTKDTEWLDAGVKYYDFLIGRMDTDPEKYKGWIGPYEYDSTYYQDALVGDAILLTGILDFSVLVLEDETLKSKYQDKANSYVEIAKKDFVEKWDKRGCWYEDEPYGSYIGLSKFLKSDNLKEWVYAPEVSRAGISHPFNKQMDAAEVCLRLYRITGDKFYWDRAEKIFFTAKSRFQYFDNHYCWNYWEPLAPGDVNLIKKDTRHWVGVHPWRSGYQAGEVGKIVEAYHYGMVFDEQDMQRIINTNLNVMWNKDKVNPSFINSNGLGADHDTLGMGAFQAVNGHSNAFKNAGELWTSLLDFDQTIRDLYELRFKKDDKSIRRTRYENTVLKNPPSFKRKYAKGEVTVPVVNFTECKDLYLATVLPHIITKGEKSIIICKSWKSGELQIDLYSTDGKKIKNLYKGKIGGATEIGRGVFIINWDGKDPAKKETYKGDYRIRWTIGDGYREFPITIK